MKRCTKCGELKPLDAFYRASKRGDLRGECKDCNLATKKEWYQANRDREIARVKAWQQANAERVNATQRQRRTRPDVKLRERDGHLRRKFGITVADYDCMLRAQGGGCAICGDPPRQESALHVDHDPATGKVRGLLCFKCNNALGDFRDDARLLLNAVDYLPPPDDVVAAVHRRLEQLMATLP
jgi:hypothetical protein